MKKNLKKLILVSGLCLFAAGSFIENSLANTFPVAEWHSISDNLLGGAYATFAGQFGGKIDRNELARHSELHVSGCAAGSKIFQFTLQITKSGTKSYYTAKSNLLTKEMQSELKSLSLGDEFEFKSVKAHLPGSKEVVDVVGRKFEVV